MAFHMTEIRFTREERAALEDKLKTYLSDELNTEVSGFEAGFLLDFIAEHIGRDFYNRGVYDAVALLKQKTEDIAESLLTLEQ
jgi:uncharacterized protein (DUF2164 family)